MQDLNDYYYFARIVQFGSFTAASQALGLSKSTLSRRISQLEERLGVRLLQRTSRQLGLTEIGEALFQQCAPLVADLEAVAGIVAEALGEPQGNINFSCAITIADTILPGLLADFQNRHPRVSITVLVTNYQLNLIQERLTISLRAMAKSLEDSSLVARYLGSPKMILVASPGYLQAHKHPQSPQDLHHHDLLYSVH